MVRPEDVDYDSSRSVWNAMIDRRPAVIVRCRGVADVMAAVRFARERGLPISVRGGGHNVAGHAVGSGAVMVDLSAMRNVRVDPQGRRAWVEGGATWHSIRRQVDALHGVARLHLEGAEHDAVNIEWTRSFWQRMKPHSDQGRIYLNFAGVGEEGDDLVRRSFGANFDRLTQIKKKYDPDNQFRFNQNIPPRE
ncbi:MAG: FAD-dependent oxidoreductase [Actinomycetota bacterium]